MKRQAPIIALAGLLAAALALGGCAVILSEITSAAPVTQEPDTAPAAPTATPSSSTRALAQPPTSAGASPSFYQDIASVVQAVRPAVVSIEAVSRGEDFFFGIQPQAGQGTGFVMDSEGRIITNAHVVQGAAAVAVTLPDGRIYREVPVVGRDEVTDLAVLQIPRKELPPDLPVARLGRSTELQVGDWVVAIGNALALPGGPTVTAGIVSASGRSIATGGGCRLESLIQTDAAINPGNSGGPLFNIRGEVVGINTAVERGGSVSGGVPVEGIGFAIAIDHAIPIIQELIRNGRVIQPWLGVRIWSNSAVLANRYDLATDRGVVVVEVPGRSPAAAAGLRPGYVIMTINGQQVATTEELGRSIAGRTVGEQLRVGGLDRSGREFTLRVRLTQSPRTCA